MARIRTIKPELWTDPDFVECSPNARLLFVAGLNFASDFGVLPDKPKQLKMQCFPGDGFEVEPLVDELIDAGFWQRRVAPDGANVLVVRTFARHQKVDKPTAGRWGNPAEWTHEIVESSPNARGGLSEPSDTEWKGRDKEGKEQESSSVLTVVPDTDGTDDDDPFEQTVSIIVTALEKAWAHRITRPRAWRHATRRNTIAEDGDQIRYMLDRGTTPEDVALNVLGYGHAAAVERLGTAWCATDCPHGCEGDSWVRTDQGFVTCPGRP